MNPYLIGGAAAVIFILGLLLKGAYEDKGELEAKLKTQADQTVECTDANETNTETITQLEERIAAMVEERRIDTERREQVLAEREQEMQRLQARADELERERENESQTSEDCAALNELRVSNFCPATAEQLRVRSRGPGGNGDTDGN